MSVYIFFLTSLFTWLLPIPLEWITIILCCLTCHFRSPCLEYHLPVFFPSSTSYFKDPTSIQRIRQLQFSVWVLLCTEWCVFPFCIVTTLEPCSEPNSSLVLWHQANNWIKIDNRELKSSSGEWKVFRQHGKYYSLHWYRYNYQSRGSLTSSSN